MKQITGFVTNQFGVVPKTPLVSMLPKNVTGGNSSVRMFVQYSFSKSILFRTSFFPRFRSLGPCNFRDKEEPMTLSWKVLFEHFQRFPSKNKYKNK